MRKIYHNASKRVSLGMEIYPDDAGIEWVSVALAFCAPQDQFRRKVANSILHGRLDTNRVDFKGALGGRRPITVFNKLCRLVDTIPMESYELRAPFVRRSLAVHFYI